MNNFPSERLEKERVLILSVANCVKEKLTISQFVHMFISNMYDKTEISTWDEKIILSEYVQVLLKIQDEVKRGSIVVEIGKYGVLADSKFLVIFDKYNFLSISSFGYWDKFISYLNNYLIDIKFLEKLLKKLNPLNEVSSNKTRRNAELGRQKLREALSQITLAEFEEACRATQGEKGLRFLVKSKISPQDFNYLYPHDYDFKNRWKEVKSEITNILDGSFFNTSAK